jgi:flagellar capping protein FliD
VFLFIIQIMQQGIGRRKSVDQDDEMVRNTLEGFLKIYNTTRQKFKTQDKIKLDTKIVKTKKTESSTRGGRTLASDPNFKRQTSAGIVLLTKASDYIVKAL